MTNKNKLARASYAQQRAMEKLLGEVLIKKDEEGKSWEFKPGWNDESVAKSVSSHLTGTSAAYIRKMIYGNLRVLDSKERILKNEDMVRRIENIEKEFEYMKIAINKICSSFGIKPSNGDPDF
jgi:hypothetical protein